MLSLDVNASTCLFLDSHCWSFFDILGIPCAKEDFYFTVWWQIQLGYTHKVTYIILEEIKRLFNVDLLYLKGDTFAKGGCKSSVDLPLSDEWRSIPVAKTGAQSYMDVKSKGKNPVLPSMVFNPIFVVRIVKKSLTALETYIAVAATSGVRSFAFSVRPRTTWWVDGSRDHAKSEGVGQLMHIRRTGKTHISSSLWWAGCRETRIFLQKTLGTSLFLCIIIQWVATRFLLLWGQSFLYT